MHNSHHIEARDGYSPILADERFMKAVPPEQSFVADYSGVEQKTSKVIENHPNRLEIWCFRIEFVPLRFHLC